MEKLNLVRRKENMKKILLSFFITCPPAADYPLNYLVHPKGFEPPSSEPESEILSIELWVHI